MCRSFQPERTVENFLKSWFANRPAQAGRITEKINEYGSSILQEPQSVFRFTSSSLSVPAFAVHTINLREEFRKRGDPGNKIIAVVHSIQGTGNVAG